MYDTLMQKIHRPEVILQMLDERVVHPDALMEAVEQGIASQKMIFGPDYDLYEITKNLMVVKHTIKAMSKRPHEHDDEGSDKKKKRV